MTKRWMCLCFILLSTLVAGSVWAEEKATDNSTVPLLLLAPAPAAPALCKTTPPSRAQVPAMRAELFNDSGNGQPSESCFPAECGAGANPPLCASTPSCCRLKCCIC